MENNKLTKPQQIIFEVYDKGVQNEDCDLQMYVDMMSEALSIAHVIVSLPSSTETLEAMKKVASSYKKQGITLDENSFLSGIDFIRTYIKVHQ